MCSKANHMKAEPRRIKDFRNRTSMNINSIPPIRSTWSTRKLVISNTREGMRNLYLVLFDYVVHEINETCIVSGISKYSNDEIQPIASLLTLADAPEALHISVKIGIEGIGDVLRRSISAALPRYSNSERLNMLSDT
nr:hypothetical protein [Tanacetum cinerariifolium]